MVGVGLYSVNVYDDKFYYYAQRSPNPESAFRKRGIKSLIERRVTSDNVSSYTFNNGFLYFRKHAYSTDKDGNENGHIYRMNLDTMQTEKLVEARTRGFIIVDNTMYYINFSEKGYEQYKELLSDGIFSYSLETKEEKHVFDDWIKDFDVYESNIVYSNYLQEKNGGQQNKKLNLNWLNLHTNQNIQIGENIIDFKLYRDNVCYMVKETPEMIDILNLSNGFAKTIAVKNIDIVYGFVLYDDKIFYYDKKHNLCYSIV